MLAERAGIRRLNHGAVGDGVGEREADLDEVRAGLRDRGNEFTREREVRVARGDKGHEGRALRCAESLKESVDRVHAFGCIRSGGSCPASA